MQHSLSPHFYEYLCQTRNCRCHIRNIECDIRNRQFFLCNVITLGAINNIVFATIYAYWDIVIVYSFTVYT